MRDTGIELFGHEISAPIVFAPIGVNKIYHNDGELAVAKVAGELKLPYCLRCACFLGCAVELTVVRRGVSRLRMLGE